MREASDEQLVRAFYLAAIFLRHKCQTKGWYWCSNYLREHVRASTGLRFSNTRSPEIMRMVKEKYPTLAEWIKTASRKIDNDES